MLTVKCANCDQDNPPEARFCGACGFALSGVPSEAAVTPLPSTPAARAAVSAEFIGFRVRFAAFVIDALILLVASGLLEFFRFFLHMPLLSYVFSFYSPRFLILILLAYFVLLTGLRGQTLGKMILRIKVVDSQGEVPGIGRAFLREVVGKLVSAIFLCLGFLWLVWDRRKQGWHDKIAGTFVQGKVTTQTRILTKVIIWTTGLIIVAGVVLVIVVIFYIIPLLMRAW